MRHSVNIYQRPAQGGSFLRRYSVINYRHRISAMGGFDTASCVIPAPRKAEADLFLERHLGAFVKVYADNPAEPCWEGIINRITAGNYTASLDEMANRVAVQYTNPSAITTNQKNTAVNDTDSQAVYGVKADTLELGLMYGSSDARADNLRDAVLAARAWPQKSVTDGESGTIQIEMIGLFHTLEWETYTSTATTVTTFSTFLTTNILPVLANGSTFFDNTITSEIETNSDSRRINEHGNRSVWEVLTKQSEAGDGATPWVVGISPSRFSDGKRTLYYRAINADIEYTARLSDGRRPRNLYGKLVSPWDVRPDRGIRITDTLLGWSGVGDNPAETWISYVEYDAATQSVKWYSADNTETEAAFQLHHTNKSTAKRFGAPARVSSV